MDPKETAVQMVKTLIKDWGINEEEAIDQNNPHLWWFVQGSAHFHIQVFSEEGPNGMKDAIEVGATIMELPADDTKKIALYEHVLNMNNTAIGVWFGIRNGKLLLLSTREITGLDGVELRTMADDVRLYADHFDDIFIEKFGESGRGPGG